jgi:hypothetical protein
VTDSVPSYLKQFYDATRAMGDKAVASDGAFEIQGFESMWLAIKAFPWPQVSTGGEIEVPSPLGAAMFQQQQTKIHNQGQITLFETPQGQIDNLMLQLLTQGGRFNATVYEGTPDSYARSKPIYDCFIQLDTPDRDWENRSTLLTFSGTLYFHYFGEINAGNQTTGS